MLRARIVHFQTLVIMLLRVTRAAGLFFLAKREGIDCWNVGVKSAHTLFKSLYGLLVDVCNKDT